MGDVLHGVQPYFKKGYLPTYSKKPCSLMAKKAQASLFVRFCARFGSNYGFFIPILPNYTFIPFSQKDAVILRTHFFAQSERLGWNPGVCLLRPGVMAMQCHPFQQAHLDLMVETARREEPLTVLDAGCKAGQ